MMHFARPDERNTLPNEMDVRVVLNTSKKLVP